MREIIKIQFYQISRFGYYPFGENTSVFGAPVEILDDLSNWAKADNKPLSETCPFLVDEDENSENYKTYCFDIVKNNNTDDFILVTWNETPSNENRAVTVNGSHSVGNAEVEFTDLPEDGIPGYATYFWFIPSRNVFATIRFKHSMLLGKKSLEKYLKEFTSKFTSFVVTEEDEDGNFEIAGYSNNDEDIYHLLPDFKAHLFRKPGELTYIRENVDSINKIIRKEELDPQVQLERDLWQKLIQTIGLTANENILNDEIKIRYEIPFNPSTDDLENIIGKWENNNESKWEDIGFKFEADSTIKWLSNSVAKDEFEIDITRDNDEIVNASSLLEALTNLRTVALRLIR